MHRSLGFVLVMGLALMGQVATATPIAPTAVVTGAANQILGAGNSDWVVFAANTVARRGHYNAMARPLAGGADVKLNAAGTNGFAGGVNGDTGEATIQQIAGGGSAIYLVDLDAHSRTPAPAKVNSRLWEWAPSVSDGYILFGRNGFRTPRSPWKVLLYDRVADSLKVLDTVTNRCRCIYPGQVTDQYATWTRCGRSTCNVRYYDIGAATAAKVPNPGKVQYFPGVSGATGDLYYAQSSFACGRRVKIFRWNPVAHGAPVLVAKLGGDDIYASINVFDDTGGHQAVYFDRQHCGGRYYADIYRIDDADTAAPIGHAASGSARSSGRAFNLPAVPGSHP